MSNLLQQAPPPSVITNNSFIVKEGWLVKQGGRYKTWKKRWFVLKNNHITYHKEQKKDAVGHINFSIISTTTIAPDWDKKAHKRYHFRINVNDERPGGAFLIGATSEQERSEWMTIINENVGKYRKTGVGMNALGFNAKNSISDSQKEDTKDPEPNTEVTESPKEPTVTTLKSSNSRLSIMPKRMSTNAGTRSSIRPQPDSQSKKLTLDNISDDECSEGDNTEMNWDEETKSQELYQAISSGNDGAISAWLQLGVNVNWINSKEHNRTSLHSAVQAQNSKIIKILIDNGANVNAQDETGSTPCHIAAANKQSSTLQLLLNNPLVDITIKDKHNRTPTYIAIFLGNKSCAELLLQHELTNENSLWNKYHLAVVNNNDSELESYDPSTEKNSVSLLHIAASFNSIKSANQLKKYADHLGIVDELLRTPMHYAAAAGSLEMLKFLANANGNYGINERDVFSKTPLHFAAGSGATEVLVELLKRDCIIGKDHKQFTPLHIACIQGRYRCVEELLNCPVDINSISSDGHTPLYLAVHKGNTNIIKLLVENKANVNIPLSNLSTAVHEACRRGNKNCLEVLIGIQADFEQVEEDGNTPLLTAVLENSTECSGILIDAGADVSVHNKKRESALSIAVEKENIDIIYQLLERGINCNEFTLGSTPLFTASSKGNKPIVKLLVDYGAEVDIEDRWKTTALLRAVSGGHADIVEILLNANANPNHQTKMGITPLLDAASTNSSDCLELLLAFDANPNIANLQGSTPLHEAATNGNVDILSKLILFGASLDSKTESGSTPLDIAAKKGNKHAVLLCLAHSTIPSSCDSTISSLIDILNGVSPATKKREKRSKRDKKKSRSKAYTTGSKEMQKAVIPKSIVDKSFSNLLNTKESKSLGNLELNKPNHNESDNKDEQIIIEQSTISSSIPSPIHEENTSDNEIIINNDKTLENDLDNIMEHTTENTTEDNTEDNDVPDTEDNKSQDTTEDNTEDNNVRDIEDEQLKAKEFLTQAQELLTKADYKKFHRLLLSYKQETIEISTLFDEVDFLLRTPDTMGLLESFVTFVPSEYKDDYIKFVNSS